MTPPFREKEVFSACRTLFGPEISLGHSFLGYLQPSGAKSAFRERVKKVHPDRFADHDHGVQKRQSDKFRQIVQAYELIDAFLRHRDAHPSSFGVDREPSSPRPSGGWTERSTDHQPQTKQKAYHGPVPQRYLEFGSFLYYQGLISYSQLIEALVWQRRQRPSIGDIAQRWKWLTQTDILRIFRDRGPYGRFGEKAVRLGLLKEHQVRTLLFFQRSRQQKIGEYFIEQKILCSERIETLAGDLQQHNARVTARDHGHTRSHSAAG